MRSILKITILCCLLTAALSTAQAQTTVVYADPLGNPNVITVVYSAPMDSTSSQATGNYSLVNGVGTHIGISTATLQPDQVTVLLQLGSSLQLTTNYTLTISNVKDSGQAFISPNPTVVSFYFGGNPNGATFGFNDGALPVGTRLAVGPDAGGNQINPSQGVTNAGGFNDSGCLILINPATGQSFAQWRLTNDYSGGITVTNLALAFKLFIGNGSGGNAGVPNSGGNGLVFHWGPGLLEQYTGGASSWGSGLDITFRTYSSPPNTPGVNVYYGGTSGPGNNAPVATSTNISYFQTNGVSDTFSEYVDVSLSISNGLLNLAYSNSVIGNVVCYSNYAIPGFVPQPMGGNNFAFTSTDGSGAHESCWLDEVDLYVNGGHIPANASPVGPVGITVQPASQTNLENVYATFNVGVTGAPPISFQWYSNDVAIPGATAATYTTPLTLYSTMNGTAYHVAVSNNFSYVISSNAILTLVRDTNGVQVASVGSVDGHSVGVQFSSYVDYSSAGNSANYLINGAAPTTAEVRTNFANFGSPTANYPAYLTTVRLTPASPVSGSYTVTVTSGVKSRTGVSVTQTNLTGHVLGLTNVDLVYNGNDPIAPGQAFSSADNQIELIAGGSDMMAIAPAGFVDRANFAYLSRTGDFDMIARLTFETPTATAAKAGMMVRSTLDDPYSAAVAETVFPNPGRNTYETAMRASYSVPCVSWAAAGQPANGNATAFWGAGGNWIRIRRLGPTFAGYLSADAVTWTLLGSVNADTNQFPALEYVGVAATAANNDGRYVEADFQNFGTMVFPTAVVTITNNLRANYTNAENGKQTFVIGATVSGAPLPELVFQWQRKGLTDAGFTDLLEAGDNKGVNTNSYTTPYLTVANDDGAQYRVIAFVGDISSGHSVTSSVATLHVVKDTTPPYMISASGDATFQQITILFDGPVNGSTIYSPPANYTITPPAGPVIPIVTQNPVMANGGLDTVGVTLMLGSPLSPGVKYTVCVTGVQDQAGNLIDTNTVPGGQCRIVTGWVLAYGYLKFERWMNYPQGQSATDVLTLLNNPNFPGAPDVTELITYSGYPNGDISNPSANITDIGARISGFVVPSVSGNYNFFVRGNDGTALWVGADSNPIDEKNTGATAVANVGYAAPGPSWLYGQTNALTFPIGIQMNTNAIPMTAGQLYSVSALQKQGSGTSWLEFTWGNPNPPGTNAADTVGTIYETAGGAYPTGTAPARGGAPTNYYNLKGNNIATYVNPDTSVITSSGPTNLTVQQSRPAPFYVAANAVVSAGGTPSAVPVTYQWMRGGVNINGATNSSYTIPATAYPGDNGAQISVVMSVPGLSFMTATNTATLTVTPDTTAPTVVSASSFGGTTIGIRYDWLMDAATVTNAANYTAVSGGLTVTKVLLRPDGQTVLLYLNGTLAGPTFNVTINNVKDYASLNPIAVNTIATGNVLFSQLTALDIGVGTNTLGAGVLQTNSTLTNVTFDINFPGSTVMAQDGVLEVVASGNDIAGQQDGMHYIYEQRTGDFDVMVQVQRIDGSSARAKAGLLLRESLLPGSRQYAITVEPPATNAVDGSGAGFNGVEILRRTTNNLAQVGFANNPAAPVLGASSGVGTNMYPVWLRLRRTGNSVYVYTGADGTNWYLCGRETSTTASGQSAWPKAVYIGMATSARTNSIYTQARFAQYGNFVAPAQKQVLLVGLDNNVTGSGPADNPTGNPNGRSLWITADTYMYNLFISLGYSVTVVADATARLEDATGMSLIFWDGTTSSANLGGTPSTFTWAAVPIVQAKDATLEKLGWVKNASDRGGAANQTTIKIVNTNNPIVKGLYQLNQNVQVNSSGQTFTLALTNNPGVSGLGSGFTVVATTTTNAGVATIYYANPTTTNTGGLWWNYPTNYIAHRRVGLWLGDGNSGYGSGHAGGNPGGDFSTVTSDGLTLLTNAINWAVATNEPVFITNQPANQAVPIGQTATFSVGAYGPGPYTFQWYENNALIPGATYQDYTHPATTASDDGDQLKVVVTGLYGGSVTSSVATLTLQWPIVIISQPQNAIANNGTAMFSVSVTNNATNGNTAITYRWFQIHGANTTLNATQTGVVTSTNYTTAPLWFTNNGDGFYVVASSVVNTATSSVATVSIPRAHPVPTPIPGGFRLDWSGGGVLQSAPDVTGVWTNVPGAMSPYTVIVNQTVPRQYFRVQQ